MEKIDSFKGKYDFLSNFYKTPVTYDGITYQNSEAAFQAQKTLNLEERMRFATRDPYAAKRSGRHVVMRPDWEEVKFSVMQGVVFAKFQQNEELAHKLLATGDAYLEEGNTWGDTTWGTVDGQGKNWLGQILMETRDTLRDYYDCS